MDTFEIQSTVRNISGLKTEANIGTPELMRYINLGANAVSQLLYPLFREYLIKTIDLDDQTGQLVFVPGDAHKIINVYRDGKLCTPVAVEDKGLIGKNDSYPVDEDYPLYVNEGRNLSIYPILSTTDVQIQFRKRITSLIYGFGEVTASGLVLGRDAKVQDDIYKDYDVALYTEDPGGPVTIEGIHRITEYVGSTKTATISPAASEGDFKYALIPIVPEELHNFIVDAAIVELIRARQIEGNLSQAQVDLHNSIATTMKLSGLELGEGEGNAKRR